VSQIRRIPAVEERWRSVDGIDLAREVWRRLCDAEDLSDLGLGEVDGRVDLRAIPLSSASREMERVRLERLDFTKASLESLRLFHSQLVDCRFDRALCIDWRLWAVDVLRCSFVGANLEMAALGAWHDGRCNTFRMVDFSKARMKRVASSSADYEDCDFSHAALYRVNFWQSGLVRCTFAGKLVQVIFDGRDHGEPKPPNPMEDVDLSSAVLDGCDFRGVNFDRVRLPDDPDIAVFRDHADLRAALNLLPPEGRIVRSVLGQAIAMPGQRHVLVNARDHSDADLVRSMIATHRRAQAPAADRP